MSVTRFSKARRWLRVAQCLLESTPSTPEIIALAAQAVKLAKNNRSQPRVK